MPASGNSLTADKIKWLGVCIKLIVLCQSIADLKAANSDASFFSTQTANHFILGFCLDFHNLNMEHINCRNWVESGGIGGCIYIPLPQLTVHQNCGSQLLV